MLDKRNPGLCFSPLNGAVWAARPFTKQLALNYSLLLAFCLWICETLSAAFAVLRAMASVGWSLLRAVLCSCTDHTLSGYGPVPVSVITAKVELWFVQ